MIIGFCGETEEDHQLTLSLMREVEYDYGYMFAYSERPGTPAHKKMEDDVPADVKQRRLAEVIALRANFLAKNAGLRRQSSWSAYWGHFQEKREPVERPQLAERCLCFR